MKKKNSQDGITPEDKQTLDIIPINMSRKRLKI